MYHGCGLFWGVRAYAGSIGSNRMEYEFQILLKDMGLFDWSGGAIALFGNRA